MLAGRTKSNDKGNRRFFAYPPQAELRLGPRALRMTALGDAS